jgi:hypothetical protein
VLGKATRAVVLGALAGAAATTTPVSAAGTYHARVVPFEFYSGVVNDSTGESGPVKITVVCAGPSSTGHAAAAQTVGVKLVPVPSGTTTLGYTGDNGRSIGAFFGAPPPDPGAGMSYVRFGFYRTKPIPTSLVLPCSGDGRVTFVPLPNLPPAQSIAIPVEFVSSGT